MTAPDLKSVLQTIHSGAWFSCSVVNANRHKGTGGTIVHIKRCRIARKQLAEFETAMHQYEALPAPQRNPGKDPRHSLHFTRNLELPGNNLYKIHPLFVLKLNNQYVV